MPLKLLVIDDHPLVQEGVAAALEALGLDVRIVAARGSDHGLAAAAANPDLDAVLIDVAVPGMNGFAVIGEMRKRFPELPVIVLSALEDPANVKRALDSGAAGFIPKSSSTDVLIKVLQQVLKGNAAVEPSANASARNGANGSGGHAASTETTPDATLLTLRQLQVLSRVCQGKTNKQIASELGLSEKTVKAHVTAIFKILGVVNRTQAVLVARRMGMLTA
jgi:two-component system, NarL family, nitrate/nitrite response regulator NarL